MWQKGWREKVWSGLDQPWDLIIIGGGITGAGILRHATAQGLKALLVEAGDFSSGTSSRSSKLIHGGLRYILNKQFKVTQESVRERERLMKEAPHLVTKLGFFFPNYVRYHTRNFQVGEIIAIYDLLAPKWDHRKFSRNRMIKECPDINKEGLLGGYLYYDAAMDDCRIVIRVLREAVRDGGTAINYARVQNLLRDNNQKVCGVVLKDMASPEGKTQEIKAKVVVNAAGPWADQIRMQIAGTPRLRRVRGSHLILPRTRLPLDSAITLVHPRDSRAVFVIPWEGTTILGTTEVDQDPALDMKYTEPFCSQEETAYMLEAATYLFPGLNITAADIVSSFVGLRPIVSGGAESASKESRAHSMWEEDGMITITGGKYTTFRIMARQTLAAVLQKLGKSPTIKLKRVFAKQPDVQVRNIDPATLSYLEGRHGGDTAGLIAAAGVGELERISNLPNVWAELRWAAREEGAVHLDDILLRRARIGMLLPGGAKEHLEHIRTLTQAELGWSDERWQQEAGNYLNTWQKYYSPTPG